MRRFLVMAMIMGCVGYGVTGKLEANMADHHAAIEAASSQG